MKLSLITALGLSMVAGTSMAQETTLRWLTNFDAPTAARFAPVMEEYEAANPNINIEMETVAGSGSAVYPDVLRTAIASGSPPDVFFMWSGALSEPFIRAGQIVDLSDAYEEYGWDERFPEWIRNNLSLDGNVYGVPFRARGMGMWYRKDMFAEYGLEVPETYAELEEVCTTLAENGKYCASFGGRFGWHTMRLVDFFLEDICGAETHDALNARQASWDQPCVVEAFDRLQRWVDNRWLVPDFLAVPPNDARLPMFIGDAAIVFEGPWFENILMNDQQDGENFDYFLPPSESGRYHGFAVQWMIPTASNNQEEAIKFLDWMTSEDVQQRHIVAFEGSPTIGVAPDCSIAPKGCRWAEQLSSSQATFPPTDQAFPGELIGSFYEAQDAVVAGRMSGAEAASLIQSRVEQYQDR